MNDILKDPKVVRDYLLGRLKDDVIMSRIEEQLLTDDEFGELVGTVEAELIEDHLDDALTDEDAASFNRLLLGSPEIRHQIRLTRDLRRFAAEAEMEAPRAERSTYDRNATLSFRWLRFAAFAGIVLIAALGIWRFAIHKSDTDLGLAEMRKAFKGQRPLKPRITAFPDHLPYSEIRGPDDHAVDSAARDRAERYLTDATRDSKDAASHHALGLLYLADGNLSRARQELAAAIVAAPNDAGIHNDLGVMYLELAAKGSAKGDGQTRLELIDLSVKHLDTAISLAPNMLEPRFNKAIALESLQSREQARKAWSEYLEMDSDSKWAEEARRHLAELEQNAAVELNADELEVRFMDAMRAGNDEAAARLIGENRELIREKYLPQRLAMSYIDAPPDRRDELLKAMRYASELEIKRGDPFAKEIALFYSSVSDSRIQVLRAAQQDIRNGYRECIDTRFGAALPFFERAHIAFNKAGSRWDAALAAYFVAYAKLNLERSGESLRDLETVADFARRGNYLWLEATVNHWIGGANVRLVRPGEAKRAYKRALEIAESLEDSYSAQRNLSELADLVGIAGQKTAALEYLDRLLNENSKPGNSTRQSFRNMNEAVDTLALLGLTSIAVPIGLEAVSAADRTGSAFDQTLSYCKAGAILAISGNYDEARRWIESGAEAASRISDDASRSKLLAVCTLRMADLERKVGNYAAANDKYLSAIDYYKSASMPYYLSEASAGLLLSELALGNTDAVERLIAENISIAEKYRTEIADERERSGFIDATDGIYDIASAFEYDRGNYVKAYDYAEMSSSRALLDRLQKGIAVEESAREAELILKESATPATLGELRERMPADSQILKYSVLKDRLLIWLVSRENFVVRSVPVAADDLKDRVEDFRRLIAARDEGTHTFGQGLFDQLIAPIRDEIDPQKEIGLVPGHVLFTLPFAALSAPDGPPLIADYRIVYSPSANVFVHSSDVAARLKPLGGESILAVGGPAFDRDQFDRLPHLTGAEREARQIAAVYENGRTLTGTAATKHAVLREMAGVDVIHFAGHYVAEHHSPMASYLLLAEDGEPENSKLTNLELVRHQQLKARLIVLAACRTGTEGYSSGEGLVGLSRTFLGANVPLVVGSHWSVDSDGTAALMTRFHKIRREGSSTSEALRTAQLEMLNDPTGRFNAPFYWSAFAVYGGHADY